MFTGIVTAIGEIEAIEPASEGRDLRLCISTPKHFLDAVEEGASIACSGVCLTATALKKKSFYANVSAETLARTRIGGWREGARINLERSLRVGDELGGHIVYGHVDGLGQVIGITPREGSLRLDCAVHAPLHRFIAEKGSIAIDGVSLTINAVQGTHFTINLIPHTAARTTLGGLKARDVIHVEIDMLARYVARLAETA